MQKTIKDLAEDDRPREKLMLKGVQALSNSELLAILIRTGTKESSALVIAELMTKDNGIYHNIACASTVEELSAFKGLGRAKAATILAAVELGKRISLAKSQEFLKIDSPVAVANYLYPFLRYEMQEQFMIVILNTKNKIIKTKVIAQGALNTSVVQPREVFAPAIIVHAAAIIAAHNHPSGDPTPSRDDISFTTTLAKAGKIMGIPVLDHLVIGDGKFFSFKQEGYLTE